MKIGTEESVGPKVRALSRESKISVTLLGEARSNQGEGQQDRDAKWSEGTEGVDLERQKIKTQARFIIFLKTEHKIHCCPGCSILETKRQRPVFPPGHAHTDTLVGVMVGLVCQLSEAIVTRCSGSHQCRYCCDGTV